MGKSTDSAALSPRTPASAAQLILSRLQPGETVRVPLLDALDLVLTEGVTSPIDLPPWDNSAMDGYAARSADLPDAPPVTLRIVETIPAGSVPAKTLGAGECARIFTGAPIPPGADTVVRQEDTTPLEDDQVRFDDLRDAGRNVRPKAEDVTRGAEVVAAGAALGPAQLGMLASVGAFDVSVHRRPVVAILGSGDEIADADERDAILAGTKIASSNTYALVSAVRQAGAEPLNLGIARDDLGELTARVRAAADADLLLTTAGVSVGEHDLLHQVLAELDTERVFWRVRMRPGGPAAFGVINGLGGLPWIGLPGNPVSTMVTFELFARPAIRKLLGHTNPYRRTTPVRTAEPIKLGPPLRHFLRVVLDENADGLTARLTGPQGSGLLSSMVRADALLIVPEDRPEVPAGEALSAIHLRDAEHVRECPW